MIDLPERARYRFNPKPRLSANQIGEYTVATPARRRTIIRDAKFPKTAIVAQNRHARDGIIQYLLDDARSPSHIAGAIEAARHSENSHSSTPWVKNDARLSTEALEKFLASQNTLGLSRFLFEHPGMNQPKLIIGDSSLYPVEISVNLDLIARKRRPKSDSDWIGGLKLIIAKSEPSARARQERALSSATLVFLYCQEMLSDLGDVKKSLCIAIDVHKGTPHIAPASFKRRIDSFKFSCEEISAMWDRILPPPDYDGPNFG